MPIYDPENDVDPYGERTGGLGDGAGGGGSPAEGTPPVGLPAPAAEQGAGSGRFVNFDRLFALAQPQAQAQAQAIEKDIQGKAGGAQDAAKAALDDFRKQAEQAGSASGKLNQTGTTEYGDLYGYDPANYSGPQEISAEQQEAIRKQVAEAQGAMNATKDPYGLQGLLQQQNKNAAYTPGYASRDAAMMGGQQDRFSALREKYKSLEGILDSTLSGANAARSAAEQAIANKNAAGSDMAERNNAVVAAKGLRAQMDAVMGGGLDKDGDGIVGPYEKQAMRLRASDRETAPVDDKDIIRGLPPGPSKKKKKDA